jgi:hypothetical protein
MGCRWSHTWTKWEQYEWKGYMVLYKTGQTHPSVERRQRRHCEVCGKEEDELVRNG